MNHLLFWLIWMGLSAALLYLLHELLDQMELRLQGFIVSTSTHKLTVVVSACLVSTLLLIVKQQPVPVSVLAGVIMGTALQIYHPGLFRKI